MLLTQADRDNRIENCEELRRGCSQGLILCFPLNMQELPIGIQGSTLLGLL